MNVFLYCIWSLHRQPIIFPSRPSLHGDMTFQAMHVGVSRLLISYGRISLPWSQWSAVTSWKAALEPDEETSITAKEPPKISQDSRRKNSSYFDDLVYANIGLRWLEMHLFWFAHLEALGHWRPSCLLYFQAAWCLYFLLEFCLLPENYAVSTF